MQQLSRGNDAVAGTQVAGTRIFGGSRRNLSSKASALRAKSISSDTIPASSASSSSSSAAGEPGALLACGSPRPLPPRAPPPSLKMTNELTHAAASLEAVTAVGVQQESFDVLLARCMAALGVSGGVQARESLRRVLTAWMAERTRAHAEVKPSKQDVRRWRSKQRPSLPVEARGRTRDIAVLADGRGTKKPREGSLLTVHGSQMDSSSRKERFGGAEAAAAVWEKRYNNQVSATEKALLAKRNAEISLREAGRVLEEGRAEAARAAQEAAATLAEATKHSSAADRTAKDSEERRRGEGTEDDTNRMQSTVARERCEGELRRRLKEAQSKLAHKEKEGSDLREALEIAQSHRSLQPVVVSLGQVLGECLASLGLVRGLPDAEFHARISTLRDRAEEAGRGFLSVEGLHAAAEGARALDASRDLRTQLHDALLDASRQRARRAEADARLMEKEARDREGVAAAAGGKEHMVQARKAVEEMRLRLAVADAEVRRLKETLEQELQQRQVRASRYHAPMSNVRGIFEEGHRLVQAKMKLKAREAQHEVLQIRKASEARVRELQAAACLTSRDSYSHKQIPVVKKTGE